MAEKTIGIDIGGTKIRGILWDGKNILKEKETTTPRNLTEFKKALIALTEFFGRADRVSIGAAGLVKESILASSANIPYIKNFDFASISEIPFRGNLDNDARCFAHAEYKMGSGVGKNKVFFITLGTGVGRSFGRNGIILKIKRLEHRKAWEPEYQKLRDFLSNKKLAEYLDEKLTKLVKSYQPETVIVDGGVLERPGFWPEFKRISRLPLARAKFGKNAVAVGAAMLF